MKSAPRTICWASVLEHHPRFHVVPCGSMWFHVVPCGSMWFHVVPCGSMWFHGSLFFAKFSAYKNWPRVVCMSMTFAMNWLCENCPISLKFRLTFPSSSYNLTLTQTPDRHFTDTSRPAQCNKIHQLEQWFFCSLLFTFVASCCIERGCKYSQEVYLHNVMNFKLTSAVKLARVELSVVNLTRVNLT